MTQAITKIAAPLRLTAELSHWREVSPSDLPETLNLKLTASETAAVDEARGLLNRSPEIDSVNVSCAPPEIEFWCYDVCYIKVFRQAGCYLFLQGKYSYSEQVEYSIPL